MPELLNSVTVTESFTTYDRSYAGQFQNPYGAAPELTFHMHRATIRDSDDKLVSAESLPNVVEPYAPAKVYDLFNPATGEKIPGQTFTSDMAYACIYSMMMARLAEIAAEAEAARLAAEAAAPTAP